MHTTTPEPQVPLPIAVGIDPTPEEMQTIQTALGIPPADTVPLVNDGRPTWADMDEAARIFLIQGLILDTANCLAQGNPIIWVWSPLGTKDEVVELWAPMAVEQLGAVGITSGHPEYSYYFPEIHEDASVPRPELFSFLEKQKRDMEGYFVGICQYAGRNPQEILAYLSPNLDTLKAFWLMMNIGYPAFQKKLAEEAVAARKEIMEKVTGVQTTEGGIVLPNGSLIKPGG